MSDNFNLPKENHSDIWLTNPDIITKLGGPDYFELDPCSYFHPTKGIIVPTAQNYFFEKDDGLSKEWNYKSIFVNFPYSDAKTWMDKCTYEYQKYKNNIVVLCFLRGDTQWFQNNVNFATGINIIKRRIKFLNAEGEIKSNGNAPSCLIAYGEEAYQRIKNIEGICCRIDK